MVRASVLHFHAAGCWRCCGILDFRRNFVSNNFRRGVIFELFIYRWRTFSEKNLTIKPILIIMLNRDIVIVKESLSVSVLRLPHTCFSIGCYN